MVSIRSILLLALQLLSICAAHEHTKPKEDLADSRFMKQLVDSLPEESVTAALHDYLAPEYREGVFENGKKAIEHIHSESPELATKLIDKALHKEIEKQDLRKRQNSGSNSTEPPPDSSSPPESTSPPDQSTSPPEQSTSPPEQTSEPPQPSSNPPEESDSPNPTPEPTPEPSSEGGGGGGTTDDGTQTGVIVPVTLTSTDDNGNTVVKTTSAFQATAQTSIYTPVTTTNAQGDTITTSEAVPATILTTTNAQGQPVTTTSALQTTAVQNGGGGGGGGMQPLTTTDKYGNEVTLSGTSSGQVITTTDSAGRTVVMTYTPPGGAISQVVVQTKTGANGAESTYTSLTVVGGGSEATATAVVGNNDKNDPDGNGTPGLQNGAPAPTGRYVGEMVALFGGAVGVAALL